MNNLQLIKSATFGDINCDIYGGDNEFYMTREQIGRALDYSNPRQAISNLHERYQDRLDQFSVVLKLRTTDGKAYNTTVYDRKGIMEICRHSNQPKADAFMDWVWGIMDDLITGKTKIIPSLELERIKIEAQRDRSRAMLLNAQNRTLKTLMSSVTDKGLSPIAVEVFGLKSIQEITGIDTGQYLPECEQTYSATEIGRRCGISAAKVGILANRYGLKTDKYGITVMDKAKHSSKEMPNFRYYESVIPVLESIVEQESA